MFDPTPHGDVSGDFEITPQIEREINTLAIQARYQPEIRDRLYWMLYFKINRFTRQRRFRVRTGATCDADDIAQEAYLVFCDLIQQWPGQQSFLGYFFSRFPWRLARAIDVLTRGQARTQPEATGADQEAALSFSQSAEVFLVEVSAGLDSRDRRILELHIGHDLPLRQVARMLNLHPRTVQRRWTRILSGLRADWLTPNSYDW